MKRSLQFFYLFLLSSVCLFAFGCLQKDLPKNNMTLISSNKHFNTTGSLGKGLVDGDGSYRQVYELTEAVVRGSTGNGSEIRVSSSEFIPHIKLFYGDRLVDEAYGEQDYISTPTRWVAELVVIMPSFGTHRLIVTTKEKGTTGHFTLEYDPLPGLTID